MEAMSKEERYQLLEDNWEQMTYRELADLTDYSEEYVRKLGSKLGLPHKKYNAQAIPRSGDKSLSDVSNEELVRLAESRGIAIQREPKRESGEFAIDTSRFKGKDFEFGVVSDTHLGSVNQQMSYLKSAYRQMADMGIKDVLHGGDLTAGNGRIYRGQQYEIFRHGADEQRNYAVEHYPKEPGITTHIIAGNHDLSFLASDGYDLVKAIARERDDFNYLGHYSATLDINGLKVGLHHGSGGVSYARSYKMQKLIEQLAPENKPNAFFLGHYHVTAGMEAYRNVFARMLPCFEAQSTYLARKGLFPEIGFYTVRVTMNDTDREGGTTRWEATYHPFYVPKKEDY